MFNHIFQTSVLLVKGAPFGNDNAAKDHKGGAGAGGISDATAIPGLTAHASTVHKELKDLEDRGFSILGEGTREELATTLSKHYPKVSPNEIIDAMMGKNAKIGDYSTIVVTKEGGISITAGEGSTVHGAKIELMRRDIGDPEHGDNTTVSHGYLKLHDSEKGGGAVKKQFADSIPLYQKMGIKNIVVGANLKGGVYAWGRYGFDSVSPKSYTKTVKTMMSTFRAGLKKPLPEGAEDELTAIDNMLSLKGGAKNIPSLLTSMNLPHLDAHTIDSGVGTQGAKSKFLASALNTKGSWNGNLDLSNKRQIKHLSKYIGHELTPSTP